MENYHFCLPGGSRKIQCFGSGGLVVEIPCYPGTGGNSGVRERIINIDTGQGAMETFITHPEQDGPFPVVIIFMDVWGIREELYDLARRVATVGYYCMVPDFYYRMGRLRWAFRDERGKMMSLSKLDEETRHDILQKHNQLTDEQVVFDTGALIGFAAGDEAASDGPMGSIGYCMGGRHAFAVAGVYPDHFRATASLHGTYLMTGKPDSVHLLIGRFRGEIYCGYAEHDPYASMEMVDVLGDLMAGCQVDYRWQVHKGAHHGYALPDRDIFDKMAAERDWEMIFAMFRRQLDQGGARA